MHKISIACILLIFSLNCNAQQPAELQKLEQVLNSITNIYLDTINEHKLVEQTIKTMFERLDPHTVYRNKDEAEEDRKKLTAHYTGIGIQFRMFNDSMTIIKVKTNSPAEKAGIKPFTKIDYIGRNKVSGHLLNYMDVHNIILQNDEDSIVLGVIKDNNKVKSVTIFKDDIQNNSIESYYAPNDSTIYMRITRFSQSTANEFNTIINSFNKKHRKNLILDLRDNPGGILSSCIEICDNFFAPNIMMLSARGQHMDDHSYFSTEKELLVNSRICIIINEKSASASEVIAGAVQDWDRGVIIGRRSYGKGLVQQIINLNDGSQIRITNSKYYTPAGRCIQKPYKPGNFDEYFNELNNRRIIGENLHEDKMIINDSTVYESIIHHRKLYSKRGISPDMFVPEDTVTLPDFWPNWIETGAIDNFVLTFINNNKFKMLKEYSKFSTFNSRFGITEEILEQLRSYCETDTSKCQKVTTKEFNQNVQKPNTKELMKKQIKSRFAYYIFDKNECRKILNINDKDYQSALQLVNNPSEYYQYLSGKDSSSK